MSTQSNKTNYKIWCGMGLALATASICIASPALATAPTAASTGIGELAWTLWDNYDDYSLIVSGIAAISTIGIMAARGFSGPAAIGGAGVAGLAGVAPDIVVTLSGGMII